MINEMKRRKDLCVSRVTEVATRVWAVFAKHHIAILYTAGIAYKFLLDMLYVFVASPAFSYAGLVYEPNIIKYVLSLMMYVCLFVALPKSEKSCAAILLHIQHVYTVAPLLSFYALSNASTTYIGMVFLCVLLESVLVRRAAGKQKAIYLTGVKNYATVAIGVLIAVTLIIPVLYNGFAGLKVFDFNYIYEMRENATYPIGFTYLFFWMGKAIVPFAIVMLLDKKHYVGTVAMAFIQLLLYMESGNKYLLFIMVPLLVVYFCAKSGHLIKLIYLGFSVMCLALIPIYKLAAAGGDLLGIKGSFYIAVRSLFHPADNKYAMYECFSQYPKMYYSNGVIGKMFGLSGLYRGSDGQVVYAYHGGNFLEANYNTGYLGESYANLGFFGMLLMSVLFALLLRVIDSYSNKKTFCVLSAVFATFIINLNDISLLTTLLSSGMIIVIALLSIYFDKNKEDLPRGI